MRVVILLLFLFPLFAKGQKKLANVIDNQEKRKVEKAKKFLNEGEIDLGLRLLNKLRDTHINEAYFHEALVGVEKQILDRIELIRGKDDGEEGEYFLDKELEIDRTPLDPIETFVDNGLARSKEQKEETILQLRGKLSRKDRKALIKSIKKEDKGQDDSTASSEPIDLNSSSFMDNFKLGRKKNSNEVDEIELMDYNLQKSFLIQNSRLATLKVEKADSASHYLRLFLVDTVDYNENVQDDDAITYEDAYDYYRQKDYTRCATSLEPLVTKYPKHFDMQLLLGDAFYKMGLDSPTYQRYRYLTLEWPDRPEGFERLSKYFVAKGNFKIAAACIIDAILVYPEHQYWEELRLIVSKSGLKLNKHWIQRKVYPIKTDKNYEEIFAKEESPWLEYQKAKSVLFSYAPESGILRPNEITALPYMELYAWYTMLVRSQKNQGDTKNVNFAFARSMNKLGFIDCYVLISLFHHDVYDQFRDLVKQNPKKVKEYFYILMNWDRKEFDQYRLGDEKKKFEELRKKEQSK